MFDNTNGPARGRGHQGRREGRPDHRARAAFGLGLGLGFMGRFPGHGPAVRRGDVRSAILALLAEEPMHGYQVIQELSERSRGMWRPSAGSIYPTLQQLEDEGLVRVEERDGRRVFTLTEAGRTQATRSSSEKRGAPWDLAGAGEGEELRDLIFQVAAATRQVAEVGTPEVLGRARQTLVETRRSLYRLLAEDDAEPTADGPADGAGSR